jgi:hypothetical protein
MRAERIGRDAVHHGLVPRRELLARGAEEHTGRRQDDEHQRGY